MSWNSVALFTHGTLGTILVVRLLSLRLHRVYRVFCAYLILIMLSAPAFIVQAWTGRPDYRTVYLVFAVGGWVLTLWLVYALLDAILTRLPGILTFSRVLLMTVFGLATLLALMSARSEFHTGQSAAAAWSLKLAVVLSIPIERAVTTVALISLLAIQAFILWFPVQLPRNLVFFSLGFVFDFISETGLLVVRGLMPDLASGVLDPIILFVQSGCFLYFSLVITRRGEGVPVRIGHTWNRMEQERLVGRLEAINGALLKSARQ